MAAKRIFWRSVAGILGLLLIICVVANSVHEEAIPHQITLLLFGSLIALGVGATIVNPGTSPVILPEHEEARFRGKQYVVGFAFSLILTLLIVLTDLRESALAWLFAPIIGLPFVLFIRERVKRG